MEETRDSASARSIRLPRDSFYANSFSKRLQLPQSIRTDNLVAESFHARFVHGFLHESLQQGKQKEALNLNVAQFVYSTVCNAMQFVTITPVSRNNKVFSSNITCQLDF